MMKGVVYQKYAINNKLRAFYRFMDEQLAGWQTDWDYNKIHESKNQYPGETTTQGKHSA